MESENDKIGIRAPPGTKARIQEYCGYGRQYHTISDFINAAIDEKLNPLKRDEILKQELIALNRRDPEFFRLKIDPIKRIEILEQGLLDLKKSEPEFFDYLLK